MCSRFEGDVMNNQERKNQLEWRIAKLMKDSRQGDPAATEALEKIKALLPKT